MAEADGSVVIEVVADGKKAEAQLDNLQKKATETGEAINKVTSPKKMYFNTNLDEVDRQLQDLGDKEAKLTKQISEYLQNGYSDADKELVELNAELDNVLYEAERLSKIRLQGGKKSLTGSQMASTWEEAEAAQSTAEATEEIADNTAEAAKNTDKMAEGVKKANKSAKGFASRMKKLAASALVFSVITQALRGFRDWIGDVVKVTPEASAAVAKLKGALLTMVQPLVNVIIPAFTTLVNVLTAVIGKLAQLFSFLAGTSVESSAQAAEALNEQTEALNGTGSAAKKAGKSLASFDEINKLSNNESGGGSSSAIQADFTDVGDMTFLKDRIQTVAEDIKALFSDVKSFISDIFSGDWGDAIQKIFDFFDNIRYLARDLALTVDDIFGEMVDKIVEKFELAETPIGEMLLGIKGMVHGVAEMISAIVNHSLEDFFKGLADFLDGFRTFANGILELSKKVVSSLLDWLDEKTHGRFSDIIGTVKQFVVGLIDSVKQIFNGLTDFLIGAFTGDWKRAVNGLHNIWIGFVNGIITVLEGAVNIIITAINWVISQINSLLSIDVPDWVPVFGGKSWSPDISPIPLKQFDRIPALARGAVIPPNREFLAVLGDQKSGTNIETPLPTMIQAFKQALAESGYSGKSEAYLMLDDIQLGKVIYRLNKAEGNRIGVSLVGV